jgi:hypothetical protein
MMAADVIGVLGQCRASGHVAPAGCMRENHLVGVGHQHDHCRHVATAGCRIQKLDESGCTCRGKYGRSRE